MAVKFFVPLLLSALLSGVSFLPGAQGQGTPETSMERTERLGPFNAQILPDGPGLRLAGKYARDPLFEATSPWTMRCWFNLDSPIKGLELIAGMGDVSGEYPRFLALEPGRVVFWMGAGNQLAAPFPVQPGSWHLLAATSDGTKISLFADGKLLTIGALTLGAASPVLQLAPPLLVPAQGRHFSGKIAGFTVSRYGAEVAEISALERQPPVFDLLNYDVDSKSWPVQTRAWGGYLEYQEPSQLPGSKAPYSLPHVLKREPAGPSLVATRPGEWALADGWTLQSAPKISLSATQISSPGAGVETGGWMRATVPGTVLTTLVDNGVYPEPEYGLNNLAIPESLNKQDYWYRNEFVLPAPAAASIGKGGHLQITFDGINYTAEVWLNGARLGTMKGAFRRGSFDVTNGLKADGKNVLAVRISPPPHPGIPQEQSMLGGPGENGGAMELDGPTFVATEGWDWIPAIRDRNSGIWQPVKLTVTRGVRLSDPQVVTTFRNHSYDQADVAITVPLVNLGSQPQTVEVAATIGQVRVTKTVALAPGSSEVRLAAAEFPQLTFAHPRLWWPNGYGKPELYDLELSVSADRQLSDSRHARFGMREVSYELSLLNQAGNLKRVQFTPANATGAPRPIVDVSHEAMRQIAGADGIALNLPEAQRGEYGNRSFVSSLAAGAELSPAIQPSADLATAPYLVIVVNGVRIAARGGNWGMDDDRKRVSRQHLEPFFRLDRDANMNIIRNWVGQNTEEVFYELADEYGMMVWNDFWESTQNYNLEADDPQLFLSNAEDTIRHFRNHPSIVLWCGRNEGVPQPIVNLGLESLVRTLDGTRFYSPSSNQINLQQSGPYSYQDPSLYYTTLNRGFSVETGTPSMSTLESFKSTTPAADQWPMDDVWAYHDWHFSGNGDIHPFLRELETEFGAPTSLEDFERKAQMLNYVDHRAIFEGMNANLWSPNSGRLLWMTQPAWPSTVWQILSSDYDTQASFYGTKKACEPLHVQLNLSTFAIDVVNTTPEPRDGLKLSARVYSLDNHLLSEQTAAVSLDADSVQHVLQLAETQQHGPEVRLAELTLLSQDGSTLSKNIYWLGKTPAALRALNALPMATVQLQAGARTEGDETVLTVHLQNPGSAAALSNKLTVVDAAGDRILPAYYSDNYVSLLPGEQAEISIRIPRQPDRRQAGVQLRGWNAQRASVTTSLPR